MGEMGIVRNHLILGFLQYVAEALGEGCSGSWTAIHSLLFPQGYKKNQVTWSNC